MSKGIEHHPMLPRIAKAILNNESSRSIATWVRPAVSHATICRYARDTVSPVLAKAARLEQVLPSHNADRAALSPPLQQDSSVTQFVTEAISAAPILSAFRNQINDLRARTERALDRAERDDFSHLPLMAGLIGQGHKNAELLGRATGELQEQQAPAVAIQIVMPSASPAPSSHAQGLIETIDISTVRR